MDESPRITELRKKLEKDPGSRLFAQLAEELRKAGQLDEAIVEARSGLEKHPNYPSARLTLARALLDYGRPEDARPELHEIVKTAPDNILASRLLAEAFDALGQPEQAVLQYERTLRLSPEDKAIQARIAELRERLDSAPTLDLRSGPSVPAPPPQPVEPSPPPKGLVMPTAAQAETPASPPPAVAPAAPLDRDLASGTLTGSMTVADLGDIVAPQSPAAASQAPTRDPGLEETIGTGEFPAIEVPEETLAPVEPTPSLQDESPISEMPSVATFEVSGGDVEAADAGAADFEPVDPGSPAPPGADDPTEAPADLLASVPVPGPIEHGPDDVGATTLPLTSVTLADLYLQQGLKAEATAVLSQVLRAEPENKEARLKLDEVSRPDAPPPAPEPEPRVPVVRTRAAVRVRTIASLNAFLDAVEREAIEQRASERGAL